MTLNETLPRAAGVAAALAVVGLVAGACGSDDSTAADTTETASEAAAAASGEEASGSGDYADGEYSATGEYVSPGGPQEVGVTVTLANSVVTAVSVDTSQTQGTSKEFQDKFAGGIDEIVVGQNIDELDVDKVSGSSLTSGGFNDAIEQIKSEAQA
ncbi:FMN-binding protein [Gordonia sp. LSe1-13]|uniref:FMN-binding protein n=1 Tax=Gordonia sesuvii TaxID=3116777 RepID=A0ABU7M817_9ACTN|nr:FMN-binding protein [Gordonia sp. LSe1-13]